MESLIASTKLPPHVSITKKTFSTNLGVFAPSRLGDKNKQPLNTSHTLKGSMQDSLTQLMTKLKCKTHDASASLYPFYRKGTKTAKDAKP